MIQTIAIVIILAVGGLFVRLYFRTKALQARDKQNGFALFLMLREYAYCDAGLEKTLRILGNLDSPTKDAIAAATAGDFIKAQQLLDDAQGEPDVLRCLVQARIRQASGDIEGAKQVVLSILAPDEECRSAMTAWSVLRELGHMPSDQESNKILGVISEFTLNNELVLVAGYADGDARLLTGKGFAMVGVMQEHPELYKTAKLLVKATQPLLELFQPCDSHSLPEPDRFKISVLTPSGLRVIDGETSNVLSPDHALYPIGAATKELLTNFRIVGQSMGVGVDN